MILLRMGLQVA